MQTGRVKAETLQYSVALDQISHSVIIAAVHGEETLWS